MILRKGFLVVLSLVSLGSFADSKTFTISSSSLPAVNVDGGETQDALILRLRHQLVVDWLQKKLGTNYSQYESKITPKFTEPFVLDYSVSRAPGKKNVVELTGHLDVEGLQRWVRGNEAKSTASVALRPVFLISSTLPGLTILPKESAMKARDSSVGQAAFSQINNTLVRFNMKANLTDDGRFSLQKPATYQAELKALQSYVIDAGYNSAVWFHMSPCRGCGIRTEIYFYNLMQPRLVTAIGEDISADPAVFTSSDRIKAVFKDIFKEFGASMDEAVSSGGLLGAKYALVVQDLPSNQAVKETWRQFAKQDFLVDVQIKRGERRSAEFSALSSLPPDEIKTRLDGLAVAGSSLKVEGGDSSRIVLRFGP